VTLAQRFAQIFGAIYLVVGILGFLPFLVVHNPALTAAAIGGPFTGLLINLFVINWFHNLAHILIGVGGLVTFRDPAASSTYALVVGVAYLVLFILGIIFGLRFLGGLLPLNGWDHALHLLTALIAFGAFFASRGAPATSPRA
jgi:Domain of unknown function (DUF4383)